METTPSNRSKRGGKELEVVAGNGLLDRRAFLRGGAVFAAAMTGYTFVQSAAAEPLADDPWSKVPGNLVPAYGVPSRFEKNVVRTLSNPKGEPRTQHARTPHHLLNGTITPNGLHFVISHAGDADIDPDKHRLVIHGLVKRPLGVHARCACALPDGVAHDVRRMRRQQRAVLFQGADPGQRAGAAWARFLRRVDRRAGSPLCSTRPASIRRRQWLVAEGADAPALSRSVPLTKALDDAMIALYQNGERLMPGNGYPMRLLLPGWEGNMNVKWLRRIKLVDQPAMSYYEARTYAPILPGGKAYQFYFLQEVKSFITHPSPGMMLKEAGLLRDFRHRLFGQRPDFEGHGVRRWRSELGASGAAGTGAQQGFHPVPRALELEWRPGDPAKPRVGRGRQRAADARSSRGPARPDDEGPARDRFSGPAL